jgi:hypothetical protein
MKIITHTYRALKRAADIIDPEDTSAFEINNEGNLVIEQVPAPLINLGVIALTAFNGPFVQDSFVGSVFLNNPPSSPQLAVGIVVFSKGLWRITIDYSYVADFNATSPFNSLQGGQVVTNRVDPNSGLNVQSQIIVLIPRGIGPFTNRTTFKLLLDQDQGWSLRAAVGATGIAQNQSLNVHVTGEKYV